MSNATYAIVAHQGGWDETMFVLLPVAIFAGLLAVANRRATAAASQGGAASADEGPDSAGHPESPSSPGSPKD